MMNGQNSSVLEKTDKGILFIEKGDLEKAEECFRSISQEYPVLCSALFNLGTVLALKGNNNEALSHFIKVLKIESNSVDALNEIGLIHYKEERYHDAEIAFLDALFINENDSKILNNLGVLCFVQNRGKEAFGYFSKAVEIEPDNEDYKINLKDTISVL